MRGDRTGTIGFLDELFGFGASRSGLIGIGVDIGLRDRGIIRLPPRLARLLMQQVAGPFRGRAAPPHNCSGSGRDLTQDLDLPEERRPPETSNWGSPLFRTIVRSLRSPPDLRVRSKKKIKKMLFVVDQGRNGCYNIVRQQPLAACCGIPRGP